ncbi:uncharacterized protein LOC114873447 [Osmia bicornis bicornis]|uniref:uncharacterized protein LOC114873447 n=1 Tax=Osmia bicornis bicornis TaxID=1437191 RepID=UPI0010F8C738|nr:uncharacterized protein LOC114873447 [Osmia bicornis bicornis]
MKCYIAIALLALFAVAFAAEQPAESEKIEPVVSAEPQDAPRDKRGLLLGYTAPVAYTSYAAPVAYSASYSVPYAYRTYPTYPYYSSYYLG